MSGMVIGALEIQMLADLARLRQDMDGAKNIVGNAMGEVKRMADLAGKALGTLIGVGTVAGFAALVKGSLDSAAALHDLSIQTGASVAALGAFKSIGSFTETSLDSISGAMGKLAKNMALTDEDSKGAALAIKALGINFDEFKSMSPEQQMLAVAQSMGQYKDGADKSAAATLLFGKEGAKLLPFLADLGDQAEAVSAKLTDQEVALRATQGAMADAFGDNLTQLRKNGEGWKKDLSMGLLPALYEASQALVDMGSGTNGLKAQIAALSKDGTLAEWARGAAVAFSYLVDVGQGLFSLLPMLGKVIAGVAASSSTLFGGIFEAVQRLKSGDISGAWDSLRNGFAGVQTIASQAGADISDIWGQKLLGATFRDRMADLKGVGVQAVATKKDLNLVDVLRKNEEAKKAEAEATRRAAEEEKRRAAEIEKATRAGDDLVRNIERKNLQLEQELALGRKLTPVEQENLKLTQDLADGKIILGEAEAQATRKKIAYGAALEEEIRLQGEAKKASEAAQQARVKEFDAISANVDKLREEAQQQAAANSTLATGVDVTAELAVAKLREAAASADRQAIIAMERQGDEALAEQFRQQATGLRDLADLKEQGIALKAAQDAAKEWQKTTDSINSGLTDALMRAFEQGHGFWDAFKTTLVNAAKTLVLKPIIEFAIKPVGNAISSILGGLGGGGAGGAGGGGGGLSGLGGLSSLGSLLTDFGGTVETILTSLANKFGSKEMQGWLAQNSGTVGDVAGMAGDAMGYLNAIAQLSKGNYGAAAGSAIGTYFGGPIGAAIGQAIGSMADKVFAGGAGTPHTGSVVGFSGGTASTMYGDPSQILNHYNAGTDSALRAAGGSTMAVLNGVAQAFGGAANFGGILKFAADGRDASIGDLAINRGGRDILNWGAQTGDYHHYAADGAEGYKTYLQDLAKGTRQALETINLPQWARDALGALGDNATLEDVGKAAQGIVQTQQALLGLQASVSPLGGVFANVAGLSSDALLQLTKFAGGIDAFTGKVGGYVKDYYSQDEQGALAAQAIRKQLAGAGVNADTLQTKEQFRALVDGTDVSTEAGRKQLAALLDVAQSFAQLSDYLGSSSNTLGTLAGRAPAQGLLASLLTDAGSGTAGSSDAGTALLEGANAQLATVAGNTAATVTQLQALVATQAAANTAMLAQLAALQAAVLEQGRLADLANNGGAGG